MGFHGYVEIYSHKICNFAAVKVSLYQSGTKDAKKNLVHSSRKFKKYVKFNDLPIISNLKEF